MNKIKEFFSKLFGCKHTKSETVFNVNTRVVDYMDLENFKKELKSELDDKFEHVITSLNDDHSILCENIIEVYEQINNLYYRIDNINHRCRKYDKINRNK